MQALYQQEMEGTPLATLLHEFHHHRLGATIDGVEYADAEISFFDDIVKGVDARREELDGLIEVRGDRARLTRKGRLLANEVALRLR